MLRQLLSTENGMLHVDHFIAAVVGDVVRRMRHFNNKS